ncbi:Signal transduction histidine kinase CheA [Minicystis rosea]|nr:Signal transduction histidine kinase CheA [Minicystis rosea]
MPDVGDRARDEFLSEAQEIVEGLGRDLLALDEGVRAARVDPGLVNDVFRAVHTLKGLAGLFGANRMASLSHELEELLDHLRLGRLELTPSVLDLLFRSVELYGKILQAEKEGRDQAIPEVDELVRDLHRGTGGQSSASPAGQYELDPSLLAVLTEYEEHRLRTNIAQGLRLYRLRVQFQLATIDQALDDLKAAAKPHGEIITYLPTGAGADADSIELDILMASAVGLGELRGALGGRGVDIEEIARRAGAPTSTGQIPQISAPPRAPLPSMPPPGDLSVQPPGLPIEQGPPSVNGLNKAGPDLGTIRSVAQTVRVDIHKLDRLMNIVGELSIVRTSLARLVDRLRAQHVERELAADLQRLQRTFDRHLGAMQQGILEVRMVPLGQVFDKLARVVRQISRDAEKLVNLVITGAETEVDKLIVEELSDPLMHMMRNAIDHGIETRAEREAVGKPAVGTIALNAFQKGNHVVIEIEDDGRGIHTAGLLDAAVRRGMLSTDEARNMSRTEILNLVFIPGLSTKADVSELSGRGVGMDVVKTNIAKLGGVIDLQSEEGIGTKMTVTLPITLAIISALVVRLGVRLFAIPLANVQEAVVLDPSTVRLIDGREVVTLRGSTLQLCRLARLFGLEGVEDGPNGWGTRQIFPEEELSATQKQQLRVRDYVVVTAVGTRRLGLVVSTLVGEQDVVIKALGPSLKGVRGFAGASELGDQRIALVIDAPALIEEMTAGGTGLRADPRGFHG